MNTTEKRVIMVETTVNASIEKVWELFITPKHIKMWNYAIDTWHTPKAENDLRVGGKFNYRMEAKDGSAGFDFGGVYNEVKTNKIIAYTIGDGRKVNITFVEKGGGIHIVEKFEAENTNPIEMQRDGWQAILNNFKKYVESNE